MTTISRVQLSELTNRQKSARQRLMLESSVGKILSVLQATWQNSRPRIRQFEISAKFSVYFGTKGRRACFQ